jgi:hypothetical protein
MCTDGEQLPVKITLPLSHRLFAWWWSRQIRRQRIAAKAAARQTARWN